MDPGSVVDQTTSALSNLPSELAFLLNELRERDVLFYDYRKKIQQYDLQIHKFIKQNGSLAENPKEASLYPKMRLLFAECRKLQEEKSKIANSALFLVARHLTNLEEDIKELEKAGHVTINEDGEMALPIDLDYVDEALMATADTYRTANTMGAGNMGHKRSQSRRMTTSRAPAPMRKRQKLEDPEGRVTYRVKTENDLIQDLNYLHATSPKEGPQLTPTKGEGEDQTLYCFCRQVSFGEMIACDNLKCEYEWFHYKCVGLTEEPTGKWFCPDCLKKKKKRK